MGTKRSEAWEDLGGERHTPTTPKKNIDKHKNTIDISDKTAMDMLEVIISMRVDATLSGIPRTEAQIFFDEIKGILQHIERIGSGTKSNMSTNIRQIGEKQGIKRTLLDGFLLYQELIAKGNSLHKKRLDDCLGGLSVMKEDELKDTWRIYNYKYTHLSPRLKDLEKIIEYYKHQQQIL